MYMYIYIYIYCLYIHIYFDGGTSCQPYLSLEFNFYSLLSGDTPKFSKSINWPRLFSNTKSGICLFIFK